MTPQELDQQAFGRALLLFVMSCAFFYLGSPGMTIFCCLVGIAWLVPWHRASS